MENKAVVIKESICVIIQGFIKVARVYFCTLRYTGLLFMTGIKLKSNYFYLPPAI